MFHKRLESLDLQAGQLEQTHPGNVCPGWDNNKNNITHQIIHKQNAWNEIVFIKLCESFIHCSTQLHTVAQLYYDVAPKCHISPQFSWATPPAKETSTEASICYIMDVTPKWQRKWCVCHPQPKLSAASQLLCPCASPLCLSVPEYFTPCQAQTGTYCPSSPGV